MTCAKIPRASLRNNFYSIVNAARRSCGANSIPGAMRWYACEVMPSVTMRPRSPALAPFVEHISYHENDFPVAFERILPRGGVDLMVNFHEDAFRTYDGEKNEAVRATHGAVLGGPSSHSTVIDTQEMRCLMNVSFRYGGAWPFFKTPLEEMHDQLVELDLVWGRDGATFRERLLEACTLERKFQILESVLLAHLSRAQALDPLIPFAISAFDRGAPVAAVASRLGQLPKTFIRRFRGQTGLSPKHFSRILRMQRFLRAASSARDVDWAGLATEHGFTDQAHMIHEFREFTSLTPSAYRPRSANEHNHVPVVSCSH